MTKLTLEQIEQKAADIISKIIGEDEHLIDSDTMMGSRDQLTKQEEYEDEGYVTYAVYDDTWEKETNDMLSIAFDIKDNGFIDVGVYTYGNGTLVGKRHEGLTEEQLITTVAKIIENCRRKLPAPLATKTDTTKEYIYEMSNEDLGKLYTALHRIKEVDQLGDDRLKELYEVVKDEYLSRD